MIYIGGLSIEYQSSEGCPIDILGGLSNLYTRRVVHMIYIEGLSI